MAPKHNTTQTTERMVQFRAHPQLVERFSEIAAKRERTLSQELRYLMQRRIDEDTEPEEIAA